MKYWIENSLRTPTIIVGTLAVLLSAASKSTLGSPQATNSTTDRTPAIATDEPSTSLEESTPTTGSNEESTTTPSPADAAGPSTTATKSQYDPLRVTDETIETIELTVNDKRRSREVPVLVYLPKTPSQAPVIIHSHGLGGTKNTSPFLGKQWAARGYLVVFLQHPGSDDSVWKDVPLTQRMQAMQQAATGKNLNLRTADVSAVIDQLEKWNIEVNHALCGRLDLKHIGMSGHSFGAVTTQHVAGQRTAGQARSVDERILAAIPMSPSSPQFGKAVDAFGKVNIPWLCLTGTKDISRIANTTLESRLAVFPALPPGDKYELVLHEAEHSVFTELSGRRNQKKANPQHHSAIKAITTAFWDAYLRDDVAAKAWLKTDAVRSVLDKPDRWQSK